MDESLWVVPSAGMNIHCPVILSVDSPVPFSEIKQKLILELPRATSQPENPPKFWEIDTEKNSPVHRSSPKWPTG